MITRATLEAIKQQISTFLFCVNFEMWGASLPSTWYCIYHSYSWRNRWISEMWTLPGSQSKRGKYLRKYLWFYVFFVLEASSGGHNYGTKEVFLKRVVWWVHLWMLEEEDIVIHMHTWLYLISFILEIISFVHRTDVYADVWFLKECCCSKYNSNVVPFIDISSKLRSQRPHSTSPPSHSMHS